jgi:hypothetical protein
LFKNVLNYTNFTQVELPQVLFLPYVFTLAACTEVLIHKHGLPINAHAPAPSGREPILQGCAEVLIQEHGLVIPTRLVLRLLLKPKNKKYKKIFIFSGLECRELILNRIRQIYSTLHTHRRWHNINTLMKSSCKLV